MLAAKKGVKHASRISLRKHRDIGLSENKFKKALNKVIGENDDVLRRLANK